MSKNNKFQKSSFEDLQKRYSVGNTEPNPQKSNYSPKPNYNKPRGNYNNESLPAKAPYNFIPLNDKVVEAETRPDFDTYHSNRNTGYIELEIETKTPIYIRDSLTKEEAEKIEKKEDFINSDFFSPAGKLRIPGSSLRGMTRTMVEIVSWGKFGFYDNKRLFYRGLADKSNLKKEYQNKMTSMDPNSRSKRALFKFSAGLLINEGFKYYILPATSFEQIKKEDARDAVRGIKAEYKTFQYYELPDQKYLVVSGDMENRIDPKKSKNHDWIINMQENSQQIAIPRKDVENYLIDYDTNKSARSKDSKNLQNLLDLSKKDNVPCFYVKWIDSENNARISFGHTGFFRLSYQKTIEDHIPPYLRDSNKIDIIDIAEAIFGNEKSFAGRVFFEDALYEGQDNVSLGEKIPNILSSPKPTTFQHYLEQEKNPDIKNLNHYNSSANIRGHKLYWHKSGYKWEETETLKEGDNVHTKINPVKAGTKFKGKIRFENLSNVELGALLFALELPDGCCHKIGMAKPLGLGSIKITPKLYLSDRKKRYESLFEEWETPIEKSNKINDFKTAFEKYIKSKINVQTNLWEIDRLNEFKTMLNIETGKKHENNGKIRYMEIQGNNGNEFKNRPVLPKPTNIK